MFYPAKSLNPFCLQTNLSVEQVTHSALRFFSLTVHTVISVHNVNLAPDILRVFQFTKMYTSLRAIITVQTDNLCGVKDSPAPAVQSTRRNKLKHIALSDVCYDPNVRQANTSPATKGERFHVFSSSFLVSLQDTVP